MKRFSWFLQLIQLFLQCLRLAGTLAQKSQFSKPNWLSLHVFVLYSLLLNSTPFVTFVTNKLFAILALLCVQQFDGKLLGNQGAAVAQLWFSAPCAIFLWICDDSFGFFRFLCQGFPRNFLYAFRERWIYLLNYHICGINLMIYYVGFRLSQIKARFMKQSSLNPSLNFNQLNYT